MDGERMDGERMDGERTGHARMDEHGRVDCAVFDAHADELALGHVGEPLRGRLHAHAAGCASCRALLDALGSVVDQLLVAAPEVEPPAGFEHRVLTRVAPQAETSDRAVVRRRVRLAAMSVAAAVALIVGAAGIVTLAAQGGNGSIGAIEAADGTEIGSVRLVAEPSPHVLVAIASPRPDPGTRHCELRVDGGTWQRVGSWELADIEAGVWAVGIERPLLDAVAMRVVADDGTVLATASIG